MITRAALAALLILTPLPLLAAPVPPFRSPPVPAVTPGVYSLDWHGRAYHGRWHWDARARTLHVTDTSDGGETWTDWRVECAKATLEGRGWCGGGSVPAGLARAR